MNEKLTAFIKHPATIPSLIGAVSFAGGIGVGYILASKSLNDKCEEVQTDVQLEFDFSDGSELEAEIKDYIRDRGRIVIEVNDQDQVVNTEDLEDTTMSPKDVSEYEPVMRSVFAGNDDTWDLDKETASRTESSPYVIHRDEFFSEESGYIQTSLTYYELDDILCDEDDSPVYNHAEVIGPFKFGHGSGDPNVFYVRNESRRGEYEILKHSGSYAKEVLGLEAEEELENELKHSSTSVRRFRDD